MQNEKKTWRTEHGTRNTETIGFGHSPFFVLRSLKFLLLSFLILHSTFSIASSLSHLERRLRDDMDDLRLNDFTKIEAAFILSGVEQPDSLNVYVGWYEGVLEKIRDYPFDKFDRVAAASQVFNFLHTTWLIQYELESTDLLDIVRHKNFNCVAATILYNLICEDLGWTTEAFETNTHVYTIFRNFTQPVMVENTSPRGFNIIRNLDAYTHLLLQYYPTDVANEIGLDQLWAYENSRGREINNTELIGLLAYNQAWFSRKRGNYERAYELVLLAQNFNADSRSNINFEKSLYYQWGKQLYDSGRMSKAFTIFADGYYRHPDMEDFARNTRAAFFKSQYQFIRTKNWQSAERMIYEILDLEILTDEDARQVKELLKGWKQMFTRANQETKIEEVKELIKILAN